MKSQKKGLYIIGNWKMNPATFDEAKRIWKKTVLSASKVKKVKVIACPPYPFIRGLSSGKSAVSLGAQDLSFELSGSFTGSVSGAMLKDSGTKFVIVGHSERRKEGDTDEIIGKKAFSALSCGLIPIICIGEELRDTEGLFLKTVADSIRTIHSHIPEKLLSKVIIAYEPVWAVGKSYDTALSPQQIHEMIIFIQKTLAELFDKKIVMNIPVLYGGSVDLENAKNILKDGEVRGLLIGRKSIEPGFSDIISYAGNIK